MKKHVLVEGKMARRILDIGADGSADGPSDCIKGPLHVLEPISPPEGHGAEHVPHGEMDSFNHPVTPRVSDGGGDWLDAIAVQELLELLPNKLHPIIINDSCGARIMAQPCAVK